MNRDGQAKAALEKLAQLLDKYKLVLLVLAVGAVLLLWPQTGTEHSASAQTEVSEGIEFDLEELERRMEEILAQIEGAGEVSVLLTLKSGMEQVYAADRERRQEGEDSRENITSVVISTGSGTEEVAVIRQNYPAFQGALVVCSGGDDPEVRLLMTQAVAALTGLGCDKITVCR